VDGRDEPGHDDKKDVDGRDPATPRLRRAFQC